MIVEIISLVVAAILISMMLWSLLSIHYTDLHFDSKIKRINEIYSENLKRINEGNYNGLIDYSIIYDEPSPYWVIRVNQKLGLW